MDINLERYLILSCIMDPESISSVRELLTANDLMGYEEKLLYTKILDLDKAGEPIDRFSIYTSGILPVSKIDKILNLQTEGVILDPERFARFILRRKLESEFVNSAQEKNLEHGKEVIESLMDLGKPFEWKSVKELQKEDMDHTVFKTGFNFDQIVTLRPKQLCVIAARTGAGKTTLGMNMLQGISREYSVGLISFEMEECGIYDRTHQAMSSWEIDELPYFVTFPTAFSLSSVRRATREIISHKHVKVIMIDYLQLMSETKKFSSRHLEISFIVRQLKELAKQLNILIILICQISRAIDQRGKNAKPVLGDLKESGDIEQACDAVLLLHRDDEKKRETEVIIAKNRYGKKGICDLVFLPEQGKYGDKIPDGYDEYL